MNSIITSDEASEESEFLSALNASLRRFVRKTLKDEQIDRMPCSLRSKRFRGAKSEGTGFSEFCPGEK